MIGLNKVIQELVDSDGKKIDGEDGGISADDTKNTSNYTTDDFVKSSRQGMSRYFYRGFYGEDENDGELELPPGDKSRFPDDDCDCEEELDEVAKSKMTDIIEDIFTKKDFDDQIVKNYKDKQITLNGIPPLDTIRDTNPILIRKVSVLKDVVDKNNATGEEKAIIINHLLDMNLADVPREYKEELKKKLA